MAHKKPSGATLWVDYRRETYHERIDKWRKAWDFYSGEVLDDPEEYIYRREQGETKEAWEERAALADFGGHLAALADRFNGMAHQAGEDDTTRIWQREGQGGGFGDPAERNTVARRLRNDYDGNSTDLEAFWKEVAAHLIVLHECWVLVEGPITREVDGIEETVEESHFAILPPWQVVNTFHQDGSLQSVLVKEVRDERGSIREEPTTGEQFILYEPGQFTRYEVVTGSESDQQSRRLREIEQQSYGETPFENRAGQPVPPVIKAELPLKRFLGWMAAEKEQAIFNKESERDFAARMSSFGKLVPQDEHLGDGEWEQLTAKLAQGSTVLQFAMDYIHPSSEPVESNSQILRRKVENFYRVMFQKYEDEARQATATAIRQSAFSGQDSFLNLLVGALDEAENAAMYLMGQIEFPDGGPDIWGGFEVTRPRQFDPSDPQQMASSLKERYFGRTRPVPIGRTGKVNALQKIAEADGIEIEVEEAEEEIQTDSVIGRQRQAAGQASGVNV